ncbi:MAG: hypothetical protein ACOYMS_08505, partial [Terrimicrobiaceae bacterium]
MVAYKVMARTTIFISLRAVVLCLAATAAASAADLTFKAPDSLVLKGGKTVHGLILKNSRDVVLLQERLEEVSYPKSEIVRIIDNANGDSIFTGSFAKGKLPPWRVISSDLRSNDAVRSFVEIPATIIDNGEFKNVPYKSFRVNHDIELNIYGDPEDPAALEVGIFGKRAKLERLRRLLRSYLAGYLTTRDEISKIYSLGLEEGLTTSGDLTIEVTPTTAPDAYGAWWISLYNKKELAKVRLTDKEYASLVVPEEKVVDKSGRLIDNGWSEGQVGKAMKKDPNARVLLRGFYRDKDGVFRLMVDQVPLAAREKMGAT